MLSYTSADGEILCARALEKKLPKRGCAAERIKLTLDSLWRRYGYEICGKKG